MPSSISSSDPNLVQPDGLPECPWGRTWLVAVVLFAGLSCLIETTWCSRGHTPSVSDNRALWAWHRTRIDGAGQKAVVLLGDSRMQYGFSIEEFEDQFPDHDVVQLAVRGKNPYAILKDLAEDEEFCGTILIAGSCTDILPRGGANTQHLVSYYYEHSPAEMTDDVMSAYLQSRLTMVGSHVGWKNVLQSVVTSWEMPAPEYAQMDLNRSFEADYQRRKYPEMPQETRDRIKLKRHEKLFKRVQPWPIDLWRELTEVLEQQIERIQERGGRVVIIRFPSANGLWKLYETVQPKVTYWDEFAARTSATTLHYVDDPELSRFDCPDWEHIDVTDKRPFTSVLLDRLRAKGVFPGREIDSVSTVASSSTQPFLSPLASGQ